MAEPSVIVENLGKCYRLYPDARSRVKELLLRRKYHTEKWALRDIGFELHPGQALGIIGVNGAGKSTLLKILTGTSRQTTGSYRMNGTVASLLELGAGFHVEFSGRENIYMNAAVQGVRRKDVDRMYPEIAAFSELGDFLEHPVRTYSSGMSMRLGFAASMLLDPDILILDEVLAVGDAHFQKKCMDKFNQYRQQNKTILFVSHSVYHVREICDRAIWIHDGKMVMDGDPVDVTDEYENHLLQMRAAPVVDAKMGELKAEGLAKIEEVEVFNGTSGEPVSELRTNDALSVRMRYRNPETHRGVLPIVGILRNDGLLVFSARPQAPVTSGSEHASVTLRIPRLQLLAGEYSVSTYLSDDSGAHVMDQRLNAARFKVLYRGFEKGIYVSEYTWEAES